MSQKNVFLIGFVVVIALITPFVLRQFKGAPPQESIQPVPEMEAKAPVKSLTAVMPTVSDADRPDTLTDHQATAAVVQGDVKILPAGKTQWVDLKVGDFIQKGDQVKTGKASFVAVFYDSYYLNMAQINENSMAEFVSIEPTQIYITNGEIFNDLEGLPEGSGYDVVTPTSVAGIRGTAFVRSFDPGTGVDKTTVLRGRVSVSPRNEAGEMMNKTFSVDARKELKLEREAVDAAGLLGLEPVGASPAMLEAYRVLFEEMHGRLAEYAGGEAELEAAIQKWETLKEMPEEMAKVKKEIQVMVFYTGGKKVDMKEAAAKVSEAAEPQMSGSAASSPERSKMVTLEQSKLPTGTGTEETMVVPIDICQTNPDACSN